MKILLALIPAALGLAACNNPLTGTSITAASIAANVTTFCNNEGALAVVIAQDGTVLKATPGQQSAIAQGSDLVALNCAALVAVLGTVPAAGAPTAEVDGWVMKSSAKLHINPVQLHRVLRHYRS